VRVVVVGATGNIGTALLRRLHAADGVDIVGVARRTPAATAPYAGVEWTTVDIARPDAAAALADAFADADAVVHLAWALQPNHDEPTMVATNVDGTARVLAAVAAASVPHLVVSSSVGAYSFGPKSERVDESWPTGGIATSHYSRHKAANERALDRFEAQHPGVTVTRVRPGLVFQAAAGAEQRRLFVGRLVPVEVLRWWRPPVLPFPSLGVFQAVHADDLADAFWRILDRRAVGAFNIAAEPVLHPGALARVIGARAWVPFRTRVARWLVEITWRLRLQAMDPGWIDIATQVPVMSTARARSELGWDPKVSATDALAEVLDAVAYGKGQPGSAPLHD
jgi:nucleoside-diphosphate-sugar epimerase